MNKNDKILITGSDGMVGSHLVELLKKKGCNNLLTPKKEDLDLRDQLQVETYFKQNKNIKYVFHIAAKVGGIKANMNALAEFERDNLQMGINVLEQSRIHNVKKLLFLGSSCIYPRKCKQPMKEEYLLSGPLEPTNEGYALAKISILKMCEFYNKQYGTNFIALMPCNMYGPRDHFETENSHVVSALMTKFHDAKINNINQVCVWGSGKPEREFMYVEDGVRAMYYFMKKYDWDDLKSFVNIGSGKSVTIKELALLIKDVVGFKGDIVFDKSMPDGMMKKEMDSSRANSMGWKTTTELDKGLKKMYRWYKKQV